MIPHGIDYSIVRRNTREYGAGDGLVFCYAGQMSFHKGVDVLIEAFRGIAAPDVALRLYGAGPDEAMNKFKALAGGDPRIQFCGVYRPNDVGEIYSKVDVVIIPSNWHENNPIVLNEAFACNVPLIVSSAGALVDRVKDGQNGFTFPMGDVGRLRSVLESIIANPALLNPLKKRLRSSLVPLLSHEAYAYQQEYARMFASVYSASE
jgi:glycosyltransferase involved in cell wall biosynthesis